MKKNGKILCHTGELIFLVGIFLCTQDLIYSVSWDNPADPYPVYSAVNPLGAYTYWEHCEPEYYVMGTVSVFRQSANKGRSGPCATGHCSTFPATTNTTTTPTCACTPTNYCQSVCNDDINLGCLHGPWNMIALFYPEENGNNTVNNLLATNLNLTDPNQTGLTPNTTTPCGTYPQDTCVSNCSPYTSTIPLLAALSLPSYSDINKQFGFFQVPIQYRKYGIRAQADLGFYCGCWGEMGLRIQGGIASVRQDVCFYDQTCGSPSGTTSTTQPANQSCTITTSSTSGSCGTACCVPNPLVNNCCAKELVINGIMKEQEEIANILGLNIHDYYHTGIEDLTLNLYWSKCFEYNAQNVRSECWPHYTIAPYIIGEFTFPTSDKINPNRLFGISLGNNGHYGLGLTGGFTLNFIETVELGLEAGFTHFTDRCYCNYPVPTSDFQEGMFPRKANLTKEPGSNWTFVATLGAYHFISCLSFYVQFVGVHHNRDNFYNLDPILITPALNAPADTFVASNILVQKMREESEWESNFVDVHFTYDISDDMQLGFFWQAPVRQEFAYRSTTVMLSWIYEYN